MKKLLPLTALCALLVSCYREIIIPVGDDDPVVVMNARLNTLDPVHEVVLSLSRKSRVRPLPGAEVSVFLNGEPAGTAVEERDPSAETGYRGWAGGTSYCFTASIKPGDEVRLEARQGDFCVQATVTAPPAVTIASVDTSQVRMSFMGNAGDYLQARVSFQDLPGRSWYRVSSRIRTECRYLDEAGHPIPGYQGSSESLGWMETGFDPIISEGTGMTGGTDLGALLVAENSYACFADDAFADRECLIRPLFYPDIVRLTPYNSDYPVPEGAEEVDWDELFKLGRHIRRTAAVRIHSIDFAYYHYLKALENLKAFGTEVSFLVEPTTLPSNVEGGLGFVSLETVTEKEFAAFEREYEPMDVIYY